MTGINPTMAMMLGLLHEGAMTGGEINAIAQKWLTPYWNVTRSQVYRELQTMEWMGLVKAGKKGPRSSVPYSITPKGKREFQRWLKKEPDRDLLRNESMLRFAFGALHKGEDLQNLVIWMRDYHEKMVSKIEALIKEAKQTGGMEYDEQALAFALRYHRGAIEWLHSEWDMSGL